MPAPPVKMRARRAFPYEGRMVAPDECVDMTPLDALVARYRGTVQFADTKQPIPGAIIRRRRRAYRRRDLVAEP